MGRSLDRVWRKGFKLHGRLHPRLVPGGHKDSLQPPAPQLSTFRLERVLAGIQPGKPVAPISGRCGARLRSGGLIPHNHRSPVQRRRVQVRKPARDHPAQTSRGSLRHSNSPRAPGHKQHCHHQQFCPTPLNPCHRDTRSRQTVGKRNTRLLSARSTGGSGIDTFAQK